MINCTKINVLYKVFVLKVSHKFLLALLQQINMGIPLNTLIKADTAAFKLTPWVDVNMSWAVFISGRRVIRKDASLLNRSDHLSA